MRHVILSAAVVSAFWLSGCANCVASPEDVFVPTDYAPADWMQAADADGCITPPTGSEPVTSIDGTTTCWTSSEAHAAEWMALTCRQACTDITGRDPLACQPMLKEPDGRYRVSCTYEACSKSIMDTEWTSGAWAPGNST